ncbi:hypothetical protein ACHAQJ_003587 [Trichoderma viride]
MEGRTRVQVGNVFIQAVLESEILVKDQTINSVKSVTAKGEARKHAYVVTMKGVGERDEDNN